MAIRNKLFDYQVQYAITNNRREIIEKYLKRNLISILFKYSGEVLTILNRIAVIEVIDDEYAIATCNYRDFFRVVNRLNIDVYELVYQSIIFQQEIETSLGFGDYKSYVCLDDYEETGENTIVGVIDSGIDYKHQDFLNEDGTTRIKYILDFSLEGNGVYNLKSGRLYTEEDINLALKDDIDLEHMDTVGHGTAVVSIAAGNTGVAYKANICVVKLGDTNIRSHEVIKGLYFLREVSKQLNMPIAINLSLGGNNTSHSGLTLFEEVINKFSILMNTAICVASGNEGDARHHRIVTTDDIVSVVSNLKSFNLYMFIPKDMEIEFRLVFDNNVVSQNFSQIEGSMHFVEESVTYYVSYGENELDLYNTFEIQVEYNVAKNSILVVNIIVKNGEGEIHMYMPVIESVGENTYFGNSSVYNTLTFPSTAKNVITVGAYDSINESPASFSGLGYTVIGDVKPNVVAPGVQIIAADSLYGYTYKTGTSFAVPIVTGICSLIMQNNRGLTGLEIKGLLEKTTINIDKNEYPNIAMGYGSVCYEDLIEFINSPKEYVEYLVNNNEVAKSIINNIEYDVNVTGKVFGYLIVEIDTRYLTDFQNTLYERSIEFEKVKILSPTAICTVDYIGISNIRENQSLYGEGVITAFVDSGVLASIPIFEESGETRVASIYDVSEDRVYLKDEILELSKVDESFLDNEVFGYHGTKCFSISSGKNTNTFKGIASKSTMICSKVSDTSITNKKSSFVEELSVGVSSIDILKGIEFLISEKERLNMPMVIGIPYGTNEGSHRKLGIFENLLQEIGKSNIIVTPTGNEGRTGKHATIDLVVNNREIVYFNVQNSRTKISLYCKKGSNLVLTIGNRNYEEVSIALTESITIFKELFDYNVYVNFNNTYDYTEVEIGLEGYLNGFWYLEITPLNISGKCEMYLPIADFSSEDTVFYEPKIVGSITVPGTVQSLITIGGYDSFNESLYNETGATDSSFKDIDVVAPAVNVLTYSKNGEELMTGTSMSVAHTVGLIALLLENDSNISSKEVKEILRKNAIRNDIYIYPNNFYGYGILNLQECP